MRGKFHNLLLILGAALVLCSAGLLLFFRWNADRAERTAAKIVETMQTLLPQRCPGFPEELTTPDMPVLQIEGADFCALLEVPAYGLSLPVESGWDSGEILSHPCRYYGSVYESNLVIGGSDQAGQLDFCGKINPGAQIFVTDMTGAEFRYSVSRVDRAKSADTEKLLSGSWALTLFVRDSGNMDYLIVRCDPA